MTIELSLSEARALIEIMGPGLTTRLPTEDELERAKVESTTFAPPFPRLEDPVFAQAVQDEVRRLQREKPNANLPGSLAALQNCGKPRIDVTDGQVYATADLEGVDVPDGEYDMWHDFAESFDPEPYAPRIINREWHWTNLEGQACDAPLGYWTYLRYKGPLPEAEPSSRPQENGLPNTYTLREAYTKTYRERKDNHGDTDTSAQLYAIEAVRDCLMAQLEKRSTIAPQGLPSAEELARLYHDTLHAIAPDSIVGFDSLWKSEHPLRFQAMQAVRDAVLQALPGDVWANYPFSTRYFKAQCDAEKQRADTLEAKVRELEVRVADEKLRADGNFESWRTNENECNRLGKLSHNQSQRIAELEAELAALGTPIDPKDVVLDKEYLVLCRARITNYYGKRKEERVPVALRFVIGLGEKESEGYRPIDPIIYPYAPTE